MGELTIGDFRPTALYISETMQDMDMEGKQELVCALSNDVIFSDLELTSNNSKPPNFLHFVMPFTVSFTSS